MNYLSKLPQHLQDIVISLPFRVGLYISERDQTGGDESAEVERQALENIVTFYVEDTVKGEFAHEVMLNTLNNKPKWAEWADHIDKVPDECLQLTYALKDIIDPKEVLAYKQNLIEVAIAIAQAYCEFDQNASKLNKLEIYVSLFLHRLVAMFSGEQKSSHDYSLNISPSERKAIKLLSDNLDVQVQF